MADSDPPDAKKQVDNICMESPHQDKSNDTMEVVEEGDLMEFDSLEGGGLVAASPSHHYTLV